MPKFIFVLLFTYISITCAFAANQGEEKMIVTMTDQAICNGSKEECSGVMQAVDAYLQAGVDGDHKTAEKGFAPWATMSWNENGKLVTVPIQALYDYFDEKKRPVKGEIAACNIAGTVATVRLESDFDGARFTDMFTLVKDGNDWKIISKVYNVKN